MGFNRIYPLVNVNITMERSTMFNGKINYFNGHFPCRFLYVYQRVVYARSVRKTRSPARSSAGFGQTSAPLCQVSIQQMSCLFLIGPSNMWMASMFLFSPNVRSDFCLPSGKLT